MTKTCKSFGFPGRAARPVVDWRSPPALLSELTVLVDRYPCHGSLHGQYLLALHRSGRRSEALAA
ncbi:BTAD domain-containing putative transcriptional regulator [Kitasatospora sp. NPDC094028]